MTMYVIKGMKANCLTCVRRKFEYKRRHCGRSGGRGFESGLLPPPHRYRRYEHNFFIIYNVQNLLQSNVHSCANLVDHSWHGHHHAFILIYISILKCIANKITQ